MNETERMKELVKKLNEAAKAYYQEDREIMSNLEYDTLYDELQVLEEKTGVTLAGSPTTKVGYEAMDELPKEAHESPMLSLDKTKDVEVLRSFIGDHKTLLSWKMDGLTVVLTYRGGTLAKAVTRGNGVIGEVVTNNAKVFENIPLKIPYQGELVLRGEAIIRYSDFEKINEELAKFSPALAERPQIVVGNKCDLATEEQIEDFRKYVEAKGLTFVPISAATMQGVRELPGLVYNRLKDIPAIPVFAPEYKKPEPKAGGREFSIMRMEAHVWSVNAPWLEYILAGSNVDDYESLQYFQRQLDESGILAALVEKGVQENDTILIGDYQFDYIF